MLLEEPPIPIRDRRADVPPALGRRDRQVSGPRPQRPLSRRHVDASGVEAVLLSRQPAIEFAEDAIYFFETSASNSSTSSRTISLFKNSRL